MKRKIKLAAIALFTIVLSTGCAMKAEYGITVTKDKNVKLQVISAQDDEMIDAMLNMGNSFGEEETESTEEEKTYTDEERWEYVESNSEDEDFEDFKKEKYDKDGYKGYVYTNDLGNIDKLVSEDESVDLDKLGENGKIFTKKGNVYKLNVKISDDEMSQIEQYSSTVKFDLTLKLTLPNKAKSNNATKVEKNTYIWDLTKAKSIDVEFTLDKPSNNIMYIGLACGALAICICTFVLVSKNKTKKDNKKDNKKEEN